MRTLVVVRSYLPAKQVTVLVVLGVVGLLVAAFAGVVEAFGLVGVPVALALVAVLVVAAAVAGASLEVVFEAVAYVAGIVRGVVVRVRRR